jgi:nitroreductase
MSTPFRETSVTSTETVARMNDLTDPISLLLTRRSQAIPRLTDAGPDADQLRLILTAGARVPDHGKLRPWRFITFRGDRRADFGRFLEQRLREKQPDADAALIEKARTIFTKAPVVIGVVSKSIDHVKIPVWEQHLSAGAACMNILLAATALGFGANWITGWYAFDEGVAAHLGLQEGERMAGFIFIGGMGEQPTERDRPDLAAIVTDY